MMRTHFLAALILAGAASTLGAQAGQTSSATAARRDTTITLVGCIRLDAAQPGSLTLSDAKTGTTYRLTGVNVKAYTWRNVRIVGGLVPSPNLAAQAGAIDQTKVAMAYQGADPGGAGKIEPLPFSVTRVRRLTGSCAPTPER